MDPAVLAAVVVAGPVPLPLDAVHERLVRREDPVREEVALALPAVRIARHGPPRRTRKLALTGEEVLVDGTRQPAVAVALDRVADEPELHLVLVPRHGQVR